MVSDSTSSNPGSAAKDPQEWVTGEEPMTGPQASYLQTLCQQAGEEFDPNLSKAQASQRIDELQARTGRGGGRAGADAGAGREAEDLVRRFFAEVLSDGRLDRVEQFIHPDHRNHDPTAPAVPDGPEGVRRLAELYRTAFPDLDYRIEASFAAGDRVAHRWTLTGTHEGELLGIAPTGRRVEVGGLEINRIADGKIAESWAISDALGLLRQLGQPVPAP